MEHLVFQLILWIGLGLYSLLIGITIIYLIARNRPPLHTISWLFALIFLPVMGWVFYVNIGRGYRKRRKYARKEQLDLSRAEQIPRYHELYEHQRSLTEIAPYSVKAHLMRLLINNSQSRLTRGNHVDILQNGARTFEAILAAMETAEHHLHLAYYIFDDDRIGNEFREMLIRKAQTGVEVRLILDAIGCWELPGRFLRDLRKHGIEVAIFGPVRLPFFANNLNYRNHRKIVVVDGRVGFTGGINISDKYQDGDPVLGFWRDTHLQIEGEAVNSLQTIFLNDWNYLKNQQISDEAYFPPHGHQEGHVVQITPSGPDARWPGIRQAYFSAIATATRHVYISTPYFIPDESILMAMETAAMSGVDVKLLLPGKSDLPLQKYAAFSYVEDLLRAGVEVYEYQRGFNHGKIMLVDSIFASVGTANMDLRSFDKNFEVNAFIYDGEVCRRLEADFHLDLTESKKLELETYRQRSRWRKIKEAFARLLGPAL